MASSSVLSAKFKAVLAPYVGEDTAEERATLAEMVAKLVAAIPSESAAVVKKVVKSSSGGKAAGPYALFTGMAAAYRKLDKAKLAAGEPQEVNKKVWTAEQFATEVEVATGGKMSEKSGQAWAAATEAQKAHFVGKTLTVGELITKVDEVFKESAPNALTRSALMYQLIPEGRRAAVVGL